MDHDTWNHSTYSIAILSTLKTICKWTLKIHDASCADSDGSWLMIGISPETHTDKPFIAGPGACYAYAGWNGKIHDENRHYQWIGCLYGDPYQKGDTVSIELDLVNGEITFYKNDISQGVAYDYIKQDDSIEYRLSISSLHACKIEMIDYFERCEIINNGGNCFESLISTAMICIFPFKKC